MRTSDSSSKPNMAAEPGERSSSAHPQAMPDAQDGVPVNAGHEQVQEARQAPRNPRSDDGKGKHSRSPRGRNDSPSSRRSKRKLGEFDGTIIGKILEKQEEDQQKIKEIINMLEDLKRENKQRDRKLEKLENVDFKIHKELSKDIEKARAEIVKNRKDTEDQFGEQTFTMHVNKVIDTVLETKLGVKFKEISDELQKLQQNDAPPKDEWNKLSERTDKVEAYLGNLEVERPQEGRTLAEAFMNVQRQIMEVKAGVHQLHAASSSMSSSSSSSEGLNYMKGYLTHDTELRKIKAFMEQVKGRVDALAAHVGSKCHCVHVEGHENHLGALQLQLDSLADVVRDQGAPTGGTPAQASATTTTCNHDHDEEIGGNPPGKQDFPGNGGKSPWFTSMKYGGNGLCHCCHVTELQNSMRETTQRLTNLERGNGRAPLIPPGRPSGSDGYPDNVPHMNISTPQRVHVGRHDHEAGTASQRTPPKFTWPLTLGPLGGLSTGKLFDDRMTAQDGYKFDGSKGGVKWKGKLERYFMSKCPALKAILEWAEVAEVSEITEGLLKEAVGQGMELEQCETLNSAVWGFLSNCLAGEAETIFKGANSLNGIDAWRRVIRYIDHGKSIRLETLRNEIRTIHLRPIKNLESITVGIAEFENKIAEYVDMGGREPHNDDKKADLLAILPEQLRENLLWRATDPGPFHEFRDMVQAQAAKVMLNRRRLPVHKVEAEEEEPSAEPTIDFSKITDVEGLIAAFNKFKGKRSGEQPNNRRTGDAPRPLRAPRCANCGDEHTKDQCHKPKVALDDRRCWTCNEKGHTSSKCPKRRAGGGGRSVKSIDEETTPCFGLYCIDHEGFTTVRRGNKPQPRGATVADFIDANTFEALTAGEEPGNDATQQTEKTSPRTTTTRSGPRATPVGGAKTTQRQAKIKTSSARGASLPLGRPGYRRAPTQRDGDDWASCASADSLASLPMGRPGYCRAQTQRGDDNCVNCDEAFDGVPGSRAFRRLFPDLTETIAQRESRREKLSICKDFQQAKTLSCRMECDNDCSGRRGECDGGARAESSVKRVSSSCPLPPRRSDADADHGVRGGMGLPADEARPAETPAGIGPDNTPEDDQGQWEILKSLQIPGYGRWKAEQERAVLYGYEVPAHEKMPTVLEEIDILEYEEVEGELIANTEETVAVKVAMDSGAVDNVLNPEDLPNTVKTEPNTTGRHFVGPAGERITNHGTCKTMITDDEQRTMACQWRCADVTRPLHSVSRVTGPEEGPGQYDVLFNNKRCVVVPPGVVEKVLATISPVTEYKRSGGLYVADMNLSGFARQGRKQ